MGNTLTHTGSKEAKQQGFLVQQVMLLSPGADSGLKANVDYIMKLNGNSVSKTTPERIMEMVKVRLELLSYSKPFKNTIILLCRRQSIDRSRWRYIIRSQKLLVRSS
jgi:hypothetical protein